MELELKWQQFIYFKYKNKIEIDENKIKDDLNRIIKSASLNKEVKSLNNYLILFPSFHIFFLHHLL